MKADFGMTVTIKTTVAKYEGDDTSKPPVEVVEVEREVPLSELPPELQQQVMENRNGGTDQFGA